MFLTQNQYTTRNKSILTHNEVEELSSISKFSVFIGVTEQEQKLDLFSNLTFDICKDSGLIQLRNLIDPTIVYSSYHCEAIGDVWIKHHKLFSQLVNKYINNNSILEIGGSDSRIASNILSLDKIKKYTIIEPTIKHKIQHEKLFYIEEFFTGQYNDFDMVIHSHTLEHIYNPLEFLKTISDNLKDNDYHIFSFPNLYKYLINGYSNVINFEHTLFITELILDYLLNTFKFKIIEKQYYDEHSIFYVTKKNRNLPIIKLPNYYNQYKSLYLQYISNFKTIVNELNNKLEKVNKDVYLFGAHIFSQNLIFNGLDTTKIKYIVDNSSLKQGKRLYGTNLYIIHPNEIKENSILIVKAGQYQQEIKQQLLSLNKNLILFE